MIGPYSEHRFKNAPPGGGDKSSARCRGFETMFRFTLFWYIVTVCKQIGSDINKQYFWGWSGWEMDFKKLKSYVVRNATKKLQFINFFITTKKIIFNGALIGPWQKKIIKYNFIQMDKVLHIIAFSVLNTTRIFRCWFKDRLCFNHRTCFSRWLYFLLVV